MSLPDFRNTFPFLIPRLVFELAQSPRSLLTGILTARAANHKISMDDQGGVATVGPVIQSLRVRLLPGHLGADAEEFMSTISRNSLGLSSSVWNHPSFKMPPAALIVQVEIEAGHGEEGRSFYELLARVLEEILTFAATHNVSITFEIPTLSETEENSEEPQSVLLAALETYLSRSSGRTHKVAIKYRNLNLPMPRTVQDYLSFVRLGHAFENVVGVDTT